MTLRKSGVRSRTATVTRSMKDVELLRRSIDEAIARFIPKKDASGTVVETYCNFGTNHVLKAFRFVEFSGLIANEIVTRMEKHPYFAKVEGDAAQKLALDGQVVVAGRKDNPHGHVALVYPKKDPMPGSGKWGKQVPWIGNVGKKNEVCGANYAFGQEPCYYALIRDVPDDVGAGGSKPA